MIGAMRASGARVIGVPVDEDGLDVDGLERLLARHEVKLVALQTACQNPTGRDLSARAARRLAELALERNFFVLEDQVYADTRIEGERGPVDPRARPGPRDPRELAVEGHRPRPARGLGGRTRADPRAHDDGQAPERLPHLRRSPSTLRRAGWPRARTIATSSRTCPSTASAAMRCMEALERHLPGEYRADSPAGGHHVWVTLTHALDERALYSEAGAPRRDLHAGRCGHRRAALTDVASPLVPAARPRGAGRGGEPAGARHPRGAPAYAALDGRAPIS